MGVTPPFPFLIESLGKHHQRAAFSSGSPPLDHYLQQQAGQEARWHLAVTFVLVDTDRQALAGYYTLSRMSGQSVSMCDTASSSSLTSPTGSFSP